MYVGNLVHEISLCSVLWLPTGFIYFLVLSIFIKNVFFLLRYPYSVFEPTLKIAI